MSAKLLTGGWRRAGDSARQASTQVQRLLLRRCPTSAHRARLSRQALDSCTGEKLQRLSVSKEDNGKSGKPYDEALMRRVAPSSDGATFTVLSWNVAGLRALLKKDPLAIGKLLEAEKPDVVCLQETKLQMKNVDDVQTAMQLGEMGYSAYWNCAVPPSRLGYSGVAMFVRSEYVGAGGMVTTGKVHGDIDCEGRTMIAEELTKRKPVLVAGDLNVAHQNIDIHSPSTNQRSAGFTQEERVSFTNKLLCSGFVDVFRAKYPDVVAYSYWSYRANSRDRNRGWRLDYILASVELLPQCYDAFLLPSITGSDHCPVGLVLSGKTADQPYEQQ